MNISFPSIFDLTYIPLNKIEKTAIIPRKFTELQKKIERCRNHIRRLETSLTYRRTNKALVRRLISAHTERKNDLETKIKQEKTQVITINVFPQGKLYRAQMPFGLHNSEKKGISELKNANITQVFLLCKEHEFKGVVGNLLEIYPMHGFNVTHFPVKDFGAWEQIEFNDKVNKLVSQLIEGENIVVHCQGGIGRTGTMISAVVSKILNLNGQQAIEFTRKHSHPNSVETKQQKKLVKNYAQKFCRNLEHTSLEKK